ncbi:MAG: prepilin-type N-terminal cleavage/methylation domain-containing protein [Candidatus Omnitrophica bacterium]|nr:prepilin-type N-terminal cleavage/methylation domain-containing protein [Candidatus Omnitrophota bacterium]
MNNSHRGFTFTEVLLVCAMFALISLAVFHAFSNGLKLWARGQHVMVEGDVAIFLDRIAEDLRHTVIISGISLKGSSTELSFPAIILAPADNNGSRSKEGITDQIGAVKYTFDDSEKKIYRLQAAYGQALKLQWSKPVEVAHMIEGVSLLYYFKADRGLDVKSQTDQGVPLGVMIDVQFMSEAHIRHMRRFLIIPIGGGI